jgi:uncharacterized protein DUF6101
MAGATPLAGEDRTRSFSGICAANDARALSSRSLSAAPGAAAAIVTPATMAQFEGVAVRPRAADTDFELVLVHADAQRNLSVGVFEAEEIVAVWRAFGLASGLPLVLERDDGTLERPYPQVGRLQLGPIRIRRRYALLAGRRPRFLARRKTTRLPDRPTVWRGHEISARD